MQIEGKIHQIGSTQTYGNNGFRKREIVVKTSEQFPQHILIEFVQDKTEILDNYAEGQSVRVNINIQGREWINPQGEAKYFNSIQGWRIESLDNKANVSAQEINNMPVNDPKTVTSQQEEDDDLPY